MIHTKHLVINHRAVLCITFCLPTRFVPCFAMSSVAPLNPNALLPAMPSILLPLEHFESNDHFQQMLSIDSALEALSFSKNNLRLKIQALAISEGFAKPGPVALFNLEYFIEDGVEDLSARGAAEYNALQQSSATLNTLVKTFEELQTATRHRFEQHARSLRQGKTGIMDLPNELLFMIFKNFRRPLDDSDFCHISDEKADIRNIKNIRLTCLRFRQISSQLLVRDIHLDLSISSVQYLEKVTSHPEISKGERVFTIDLRYYDATLATDLRAFSTMCYEKLEERIECFERLLEEDQENQEAKMALAKLRKEKRIRKQEEKQKQEEKRKQEQKQKQGQKQKESREGSEEDSEGWSEDSERWSEGDSDLESDEDLEDEIFPWNGLSRKSVEEGVINGRHILSSWDPFCDGNSIEESAHLDAPTLALQQGYERYGQLFQQQDRALQDGHLVRAIAAAGAASGSDVWLSMSDRRRNPWEKYRRLCKRGFLDDGRLEVFGEMHQSDIELFAHPNRLVMSVMVRPRQWWGARDIFESEGIPQSLLYELPLAIHRAGAKLAGYAVDIYRPYELNSLTLSQDQLSGLSDATRNLRTFSFRMQGHFEDRSGSTYDRESHSGFCAFLRAAMGPENVQRLFLSVDIYFRSWPKWCIRRFQIEPVLCSSKWRNLKLAKFEHLDISLQELQQLMDMLNSGTCCQFEHINLTSGTWAAALDCLRLKVGRGSCVLSPQGAECRDLAKAKYRQIFGHYHNRYLKIDTKAKDYITSVEGVENPLRD